ncbi:MAG: SGNH/GDSL hydrolase family protein [Planctomycetes bacterium]|nr:SGNH/GDSL hydrolase family protein [Planctomycetota bacterium]
MKTLLCALALAALAGWSVLALTPEAPWTPFSDPETVQVISLDKVNVLSNLVMGGGIIHAQRELDLVFRELEGPRSVSVEGREGRLRLFFGDDGPALVLHDEAWQLEIGDERTRIPVPEPAPSVVTLRCADGTLSVLADGKVVHEQPWTAAAPRGRFGARVWDKTTFVSLRLDADEGTRVVAVTLADDRVERAAWAAGAMLLLVPWVVLLRRRSRASTGRALLAGASLVVLAAGLATSVVQHDTERLQPPEKPCSEEPFALAGPTHVDLYHALELPGRVDGEYTLEADVTLAPDTVLDVLVRGAPVGMDRGIVVSLSSDARLPGGAAVNLSTDWLGEDAAGGLGLLDAGTSHALRVVCSDADVEATLDGRAFAGVSSPDLRAGRTAFHVLRGAADVRDVRITPAGQPRALDGLLLRWTLLAGGGALAIALLLMLVVRPAALVGLALVPLAISVWTPAFPWLLPLGVVTSVLLLVAWTSGGARRVLAFGLAVALGAQAAWGTTLAAPEYSPIILNRMFSVDFRGGPLPGDFLWARHPLVRRFVSFARDHTFRTGAVEMPRDTSRKRIVALGSSSTFGYGVGVDQTWSAYLQKRLGDSVEVINAGVLGSNTARLRWIGESLVVPLQPDLVIIDQSFNDRVIQPQYAERDYLAEYVDPGIGALDQALMRVRTWWRVRGWNGYFAARKAGETPSDDDLESFEREPARSQFGESLRDMVTMFREAGAQVVFVTEPGREPDPVLTTFQDTMAALGDELGVPVVRPQEAMLALGEGGFIDEVHPSVVGHRTLGEEILQVLAREGLVGGGH